MLHVVTSWRYTCETFWTSRYAPFWRPSFLLFVVLTAHVIRRFISMRVCHGLGSVHKYRIPQNHSSPFVQYCLPWWLLFVHEQETKHARKKERKPYATRQNNMLKAQISIRKRSKKDHIATPDNPATSITPPTKCRLPVTNTCEAPPPSDCSCWTKVMACSIEGKTWTWEGG